MDEQKTNELRECPFCGNTSPTAFCLVGLFWIECGVCVCKFGPRNSGKEIVTEWNTRTSFSAGEKVNATEDENNSACSERGENERSYTETDNEKRQPGCRLTAEDEDRQRRDKFWDTPRVFGE